jgi:hypothetical protein
MMPLDGSAGYSDNTAVKQQHLAALMGVVFPAIRGIMRKHTWALQDYATYVDCTAGPGFYPDLDLPGSPVLALEAAEKAQLPLRALLFEERLETYDRLVGHLHEFWPGFVWERTADGYGDHGILLDGAAPGAIRVTTEQRDYNQTIARWVDDERRAQGDWPDKKHRFGMLYLDENGKAPPLTMLQDVSTNVLHLDLVLHLATTTLKRRGQSPVDPWPFRLRDVMRIIGKKHWVIREPYGKHNWSFLVGTQWANFPELRKIGFYRAETAEGLELIEFMDRTRKEGANGHPVD